VAVHMLLLIIVNKMAHVPGCVYGVNFTEVGLTGRPCCVLDLYSQVLDCTQLCFVHIEFQSLFLKGTWRSYHILKVVVGVPFV
jgi:hypothetical protein